MAKQKPTRETIKCYLCGCEKAKYQIHKHYGTKSCTSKLYSTIRQVQPGEVNCIHCNKVCKNLNSLRGHEKRCALNINSIDTSDVCGKISGKCSNENQYTKAKKLNLPKPVRLSETSQKILESRRRNGTLYHSDETKKKISESMRAAVKRNPDSYSSSNVCGRVKIQYYNDQKFHGSWEVLIAKYLDYEGIEWVRNTASFEYEYKIKTHLYFPDFYLPAYNVYLEVKGYEVERDSYKWSVVQKLIVLKLADITEIKKYNICTKLKNLLNNYN